MPNVELKIGGKSFQVSCEEGQQSSVREAAKKLDFYASALRAQDQRISGIQMLLMAGLMLADQSDQSPQQIPQTQAVTSQNLLRLVQKAEHLVDQLAAQK